MKSVTIRGRPTWKTINKCQGHSNFFLQKKVISELLAINCSGSVKTGNGGVGVKLGRECGSELRTETWFPVDSQIQTRYGCFRLLGSSLRSYTFHCFFESSHNKCKHVQHLPECLSLLVSVWNTVSDQALQLHVAPQIYSSLSPSAVCPCPASI